MQPPTCSILTDEQRQQGRPFVKAWLASWGVYALLYAAIIGTAPFAQPGVMKVLLVAVFTVPLLRGFTDLLFVRRLAEIAKEEPPSIRKWLLWRMPVLLAMAAMIWLV